MYSLVSYIIIYWRTLSLVVSLVVLSMPFVAHHHWVLPIEVDQNSSAQQRYDIQYSCVVKREGCHLLDEVWVSRRNEVDRWEQPVQAREDQVDDDGC